MGIRNLLLRLFEEDYETSGDYSYISQLAIITIKSLMPMENEEGVRIDQERFTEELKLWKYYKIGSNKALMNAIDGLGDGDYWTTGDDSIVSRIVPLLAANTRKEIAEEELIKSILFTSGKVEDLLGSILILNLIHSLNFNYGIEDLIAILKDRVIRLSQTSYLEKYLDEYRTGDFPQNFQIEFEREKINVLNILNGKESDKYADLQDCLGVLEQKQPNTLMGRVLYSHLYKGEVYCRLPKFYLSLEEYVFKLRKSRIEPEKLKMDKYILPDIFSFKEGEVFYHSLLNQAKLIRRLRDGPMETAVVQTRSGIYVFKKGIHE